MRYAHSTCFCLLLVAASLPGQAAQGQPVRARPIHSPLIHGQPTGPTDRDTASRPAAHPQPEPHRPPQKAAATSPKRPGRAVALSLGGTLLLAPAYGAGLFVGPAFGHFYAENHSQAWVGIGIRTGTALVAISAAESAQNQQGVSEAPNFDGLEWLLIGAAAVLGSGIYDTATAGTAAREYNRTHGLWARVTPTAGGPRGEQVGLSVTLQF
ncbi:hypothetical protein [Salinibacter ruber]|uniref:hypothetical protein n=1 Tax=Salinibacter ruber TaxID=146919 RepID=UPI00207327FC|nr:hypothetical protein [Salinibacter ruber]